MTNAARASTPDSPARNLEDREYPRTVAFSTFGCRSNQHDTAEMQELLERDGFAVVDARQRADVYVINTCTVTNGSDHSARSAVRKALSINDEALVVFTGCYAQMNPDESARLAGVDILLGNADKTSITSAIRRRLASDGSGGNNARAQVLFSDINSAARKFSPIAARNFPGKNKAPIKIQTGCDEACSFCTVVLARGKSRSDAPDNVLANVRAAVSAGFPEVTLTGINLGTYGMETPGHIGFSALVEQILALPGDFRLRLSSINPMEIDDRLIGLLADRPDKLCPHLHIPLQSGDDSILRRMRRNYTIGQYRAVIERIVKRVPVIGLGADIMTGFPGETDILFENTRRVVEELPFSYLHVFGYSPRPRTEAATAYKDDIPGDIKKIRNRILADIAENKADRFRSRFIGQTVSVLVEIARDPETGNLRGHSQHFIPVSMPGDNALINRIVPAVINQVANGQVLGCVRS